MIQTQTLLLLAFSYFLGSLPFAYLLGKFKKLNLKQVGTRNPGASNLMVQAGISIGILGMLLDASKGMLVYWLASLLGAQLKHRVWFALAVVSGHCWSFFLEFKGGRGVATAAGILFLLNPTVGLSIFIFYMFAGFLNYYGIYKVLSLPIDNAFATFIGIIWYVGLSSIQSNTPASTIGLYLGLLLLFRRITINPKEYKHPGFYKIFIYRLVYDRPTLQKPINRLEKKWKELQSQQLDQSLT